MEKRDIGFYRMPAYKLFPLVVFFIVSIMCFFPFMTGKMAGGLSVSAWVLSALALIIPIWNITTAYLMNKNRSLG